MKIFFKSGVITNDRWNCLMDYILLELVLKYGFGNWKKIINAHNWYRADINLW